MRILITGCSSGIGRVTAEELARRGHEVVATARNVDAIADLDAAQRLALDVTDEHSVAAAVERAGRVDGLVNNAGWEATGPVEKVPFEAVRRMFETNFFGAVRMVQALVPGMRARRGGAIVNVSSIAGRITPPLAGFYASSKFALEALSEALHWELGHFGIRVAVIEPGYLDTAFREKSERYGMDEPPYDELDRMWSGSDQKLVGGARPGPEAVATAIADAVEGKQRRLRWPVGPDAELVLGARANLDDETFESTMRKLLGLDW